MGLPANLEVADLRDVPVDVCVAREAAREPESRVGADKIRAIASELLPTRLDEPDTRHPDAQPEGVLSR